jgi:hypothetical protein
MKLRRKMAERFQRALPHDLMSQRANAASLRTVLISVSACLTAFNLSLLSSGFNYLLYKPVLSLPNLKVV